MESLSWAWTQPTDYVGMVVSLKSPATVEVSVGGAVLGRRSFPAGLNAWLLYVPRPPGAKAGKGGRVYPSGSAPPFDVPGLTFFAEELSSRTFGPTISGEVAAVFMRDGIRQKFISHRPIEGRACRGELTTVGDVFDLNSQ